MFGGDHSGGVSLIYGNPQRESNRVYAQGMPTVVINPDSENVVWRVHPFFFHDRQHVVIPDLEQTGLTAHVPLSRYLKMDIFNSGEIVQTDSCYAFT